MQNVTVLMETMNIPVSLHVPINASARDLSSIVMNVQFQTSDFINISTETRALDLSYNSDIKVCHLIQI